MAVADTVEYAERRREQIRQIQQAHSARASDIDVDLVVANPERRKSCERNLLLYLQTYFPNSTGLSPFSEDHEAVIAKMQDCFLAGGLFCEAVYRGFAKTTMAQNTVLWAESYGHRRCFPLFGATDNDARRNMESIKLELMTNDLLLEDFPEVCIPIRKLEGKPQRCASQTYKRTPTFIDWTAEQIVLPSIKAESIPDKATRELLCGDGEFTKASGGIVVCRGLTGASRGLVFKRPDGTNQRPDAALIDDPQTDESAVSPAQVQKRIDIIKRSILRSGGHRSTLACVVTCTVRAANDVAEQLLDPKRSPSWQGERIRMVKRWADEHGDEATELVPRKLGPLWGRYKEIRCTFDRDNANDQKRAWKDATAFYGENREAMDRGCRISWESCFDAEHEISAIQHAYNILIDDGADVFATECQNGTPLEKLPDGMLTASQIASKVNGYDCRIVPPDATTLTAFIDVQDSLLFWMVMGWTPKFTGYVLDYGAFPDQRRHYYTLKEAGATLGSEYPGGREAAWTAGLKALTTKLLGDSWRMYGGASMKVSKCLIDANYGDSTNTIYAFVRQSQFGGLLLPTHGVGVKATKPPMMLWPKKPGEKVGHNWRERASDKHKTRYGLYDTNYWKSFLHARLAVPVGGDGCLSLFAAEPQTHQMLADHITSEKPLRVQVHGGREVTEFQDPPPDRDNHFLDCLAGCFVGASMLGIQLESDAPLKPQPKLRPTAKELMERAKRRA